MLPTNAEFKNQYAVDCSKLGDAYLFQKNFKKACFYYKKYLVLKKELWELNPQNIQQINGLSIANEKMGEILLNSGKLEDSLFFYKESNKYSEELYIEFPMNFDIKYGYSVSCDKLGNAYKLIGKFDLALKYYKLHSKIHKDLFKNNPLNSEIQRIFFIAYDINLSLLSELKLNDELIEYNETMVNFLIEVNPADSKEQSVLKKLIYIYFQLAISQEDSKRKSEAITSYELAIQKSESLDYFVTQNDNELLELIGIIYFNLALLLLDFSENYIKVVECLGKSKSLLEKIKEMNPGNLQTIEILETIEKLLMKIDLK